MFPIPFPKSWFIHWKDIFSLSHFFPLPLYFSPFEHYSHNHFDLLMHNRALRPFFFKFLLKSICLFPCFPLLTYPLNGIPRDFSHTIFFFFVVHPIIRVLSIVIHSLTDFSCIIDPWLMFRLFIFDPVFIFSQPTPFFLLRNFKVHND